MKTHPSPEKPRGSLSVDVSRVAIELERTAILLRSETVNFDNDGNAERFSRILNCGQLQLSEAVAALAAARGRAEAAASDLRSARIKRGIKASLERRWKKWEETIHVQSATERLHTFIEPGGQTREVYEGGTLIGFIVAFDRGDATVYGILDPVKIQLKGIYSTIDAAIDRLRLEFKKLMVTRSGRGPE